MGKGFWGGVFLPARKRQTQATLPRTAPQPKFLVFPLRQYDGVLCTAHVQVGDGVCAGQCIAGGVEGQVPIHASASGRVTAIEPRFHSDGQMLPSIVIENDYQYTRSERMYRREGVETLNENQIRAIVQEAGISGLGGLSFPLPRPEDPPLDYLLINACECEPYVTADDSLMCAYPEQVALGAALIQRMLHPARCIIAIEDNKPQAIAAMEGQARELGMELRVLPTRYPQGSKEQLIQAVTSREIPPGQNAAAVGCAVYNVATCASVYKAVYAGEPIMRRIVTVTGGAIQNPCNLIALIGTPISHLIEAAGGFSQKPYKVVVGGAMMGKSQPLLDAPILRNNNAVLCLGEEDRVQQEQSLCLRCGKCLAACPMHLQPLYFHRYADTKNLQRLRALHPEDCHECGCCAYVCPGKLSLVETIRAVKGRLKREGGLA